jgi:hypothetical protein
MKKNLCIVFTECHCVLYLDWQDSQTEILNNLQVYPCTLKHSGRAAGEHMSAGSAVLLVEHAFSFADLVKVSALTTA